MKASTQLFWTLLGTAAGYAVGRSIGNTEDEKKKLGLSGALIGGGLTLGVTTLLTPPDDTVNYTLYRGKRRVYDGITYSDRLPKRINEHKLDGKKFNIVKFDKPKPRFEAKKLEQVLIKQHGGEYNVHHNG